MTQKKHPPHPWPRRTNPKTGRVEALIDGVWVSRQRAWQLARVLEGNCAKCGKARNQYGTLCDRCHTRLLVYKRKLQGNKPWTPGGPGRPPKGSEDEGGRAA